MQLSQPVCTVCNSQDTQIVASLRSELDGNEYSAVRCSGCDLVFAYPIPELTTERLEEMYGQEYTAGQREIKGTPSEIEILRDAVHRQMDLVERHGRIGTALYVGAMGGEVKALEERGWKLRVIDVSSYAVETAREIWGLDAEVARVEEYECPPETFDLIKLGHVIEHLTDPKSALERLTAMLKPGGILLIDTDNGAGLRTWIEVGTRKILGEDLSANLVERLTRKNLRKRYGRLTPPEHLFVFSQRNLRRLLAGCGCEVLDEVSAAWGDPTWFPLGGGDLAELGFMERAFIRADQIGARFGRGEVIAVLARKNDVRKRRPGRVERPELQLAQNA